MANQGLLIGGVAVLGVAAYFLTQGGEEPTTLEDTQATSFVGLGGGGGEADNRSQKLENPKEFLDDCATPTTTTTDDAGSLAFPLVIKPVSVKLPLKSGFWLAVHREEGCQPPLL